LAEGKTKQKLIEEKESEVLIPHKEFPGDRATCSLLFLGELNAYKCGQLLALYEHRTSIEGFLFDVNSYDQFGVELGKVLAKRVRNILKAGEVDKNEPKINSATVKLINQYLASRE
jgi:glucose-6-phosphate isomerase